MWLLLLEWLVDPTPQACTCTCICICMGGLHVAPMLTQLPKHGAVCKSLLLLLLLLMLGKAAARMRVRGVHVRRLRALCSRLRHALHACTHSFVKRVSTRAP